MRLTGSSLFCLALFAVHLSAQNAPPPGSSSLTPAQPEIEDLISSPTASSSSDVPDGVLTIHATITDKSGKPVLGLGSNEITLLDNGQPRKILSLRGYDDKTARPGVPVEVILVIDALNLSQEQVSAARTSIEKLLRANHGHLAQPVSIYLLSPTILSSTLLPSLDGNALADEVAHERDLPVRRKTLVLEPGRPYRVLDGPAVMTAEGKANRISLNALGSIVLEERRKPGRKLLFWIGPGWPIEGGGCDLSFDSVTEFSTRIREAGITLWSASEWPYPNRSFIYQFSLKPVKAANDVKAGNLALPVLAIQSGGGVLDTAGDVGDRIREVMQQANAFYTLAFEPLPAQQVDDYHSLEVAVARPELTARTSSGYYDQPTYHDQPSNAQRITLAQLQQMLALARRSGDKEVAEKLSSVELTERMSAAQLNAWSAGLPGKRSRVALVAVADRSAFLSLPPSEVPAVAPPDAATRRVILSRAVEYLSKTMLKLPNFYAMRITTQYNEPERKDSQLWKTQAASQSLHAARTTKATVLFRDGKEVLDADAGKDRRAGAQDRSLNTSGTFGPILAMAFTGAANSKSVFAFSHWEPGADKPLAVFRYAVPLDAGQFQVGFCCLANPDGTILFERKTGYHGEFAIDPASGAILRLTVMADLEPHLPLLQSDIMVEYSPVAIGGKPYIVPTRSVSISRQRTVTLLHEWGESFGVYGRFESILNDVTFADYHVFRSESRLLPGYDPAPQ